MNRTLLRFLAFASIGISLWIVSCEPDSTPSLPPIANLDFVIADNSFQPVENARIYLFPFRSNYEDYLDQNPQGRASIIPNLNARNIGLTDTAGQYIFSNYELQGNEFAAGNSWVHRPDPIYYRIEATILDGTDTLFLTNDGLDNVLSFEELDNGVIITEEIDVILP